MTQRAVKAGTGPRYGRLVAVSAVAALVLGTATFYAVRTLSRDDCTTVTNTMPDGSQIAIKTCS